MWVRIPPRASHDRRAATRTACRTALRSLLGERLGLDPAAIAFRKDEHGRPELHGDHDLHFSVSHSGDLGLVALSEGRRVGVDVERIRDVRGARRIAARLGFEPAPETAEDFFRLWTAREAIAKGAGLSVLDPEPPGGWELHELDAPAGYVATLALEAQRSPGRAS